MMSTSVCIGFHVNKFELVFGEFRVCISLCGSSSGETLRIPGVIRSIILLVGDKNFPSFLLFQGCCIERSGV